MKDELYSYDGKLGAFLSDDEKAVSFYIWAPSADSVNVLLFDKNDHNLLVDTYKMTKGTKGEWSCNVSYGNSKIENFSNFFYQFEIIRNGESFYTLDPYAKSLSIWDYSKVNDSKYSKYAKGAIINPSKIYSKLDFAKIDKYNSKKDAVIYEVHIRDFTSDLNIENELKASFGTFDAFCEKLDYIKELGVTHIQLLPVLSYYFVDESNRERINEYKSNKTNYNWGYDPQSYFALTGMYSEDAKNPQKRIYEFKHLVDEIHKRNMGVILDVVYNHTAAVSLFEDIEPKYYHFMYKNNEPKISFNGGRLASTHAMARRLIIDSIKYLTDEFKIDGFRFDMMGDLDAKTVALAYEKAHELNKNTLFLGEGWRTYVGDEGIKEKAAIKTGWRIL